MRRNFVKKIFRVKKIRKHRYCCSCKKSIRSALLQYNKFRIFFAKQMKAKFCNKMKTFALFSTNEIRKKVKFSAKNFFFQRCEICQTIFRFRWKPQPKKIYCNLGITFKQFRLIKATPVLYFFNFLVKDETNIFPN